MDMYDYLFVCIESTLFQLFQDGANTFLFSQYCRELMCLAQITQHSAACGDLTQDLSI